MKKYIILLGLIGIITSFHTGCGAMSFMSVAPDGSEETVAPTQENANKNSQSVSVGYIILTANQDATDLYAEMDDNSQVLSKMFHSEPVSVFSINGDWANISYGGTQGYVKIENISFTKPESISNEPVQSENAIPVEPVANIENSGNIPDVNHTNADSGNALVNNQISNEINIVLISDSDGFQVADPVPSYSNYVPENSGRNAWCSAESVYIYAQPSKSSAKREANMLYYGDSLTVLGAVDGWYYISTDSGNGYDLHGYVGQSYITYGESPAAPENPNATKGYVSVASANVRSSPNKETDNNILFTLYEGDSFEVLSYDGYWYKISYNGTTCYISHKMVEVW